MPQNTKVELTRELIKALLNESRQNAITPAQLAAIYKRIIDIVDEDAAERQQAVTDAQNAADAAEEALRKISEFASSIDINIDKEKFINAGSGPEIFLDSAFDIAEMSYVIDKMDGIGCNEYVAPVFLHSGDTVIGRFPAFFSRSREDEQSYWQITGCALFEYKGTVWSFFIDAVPENGDSEITLSDIHAAGSGSGTQTRTLQSSPFLQRGTFPLGAKPGVYYRNNGYIKLTFPGRINLGKEDFTASWDLSKIDPQIFPGITGRVHVPPARAKITDLPLQPGDLMVNSFLELVHSVVYDTEKKILTASFTRNTYGEFVQSFRLCVANPRNYTGCDLNYIVKHADGTIHAVNGIRASEPSLPAPELKIGKLKDITTLEELILTAREQAGWIYGYELQRKTRIKRDLADGSSIHKTKWVRQKKLHGHRIGVFRIRFRTTRGSTGPWTVFSFCHKAGNKFKIL